MPDPFGGFVVRSRLSRFIARSLFRSIVLFSFFSFRSFFPIFSHSGTNEGSWWDSFAAGCEMLTCNSTEWFDSTTGLCSALTTTCADGSYMTALAIPGSLTCYDPATCASAPCGYISDITCTPWTTCSSEQWQSTAPTATSDR